MVNVSQYRLATHLGVAFIILGALYWTLRRQLSRWTPAPGGRLVFATGLLAGLVYLQIIAGAFMAGTKSGMTYNEWPLMDGDFVPAGYAVQNPFWRNLFENPAAIQFNHRTLAYIILVLAIYVMMKAWPRKDLKPAAVMLMVLLLWQIVLGIWTLLAVAPLNLSLLHQFSSIFVFIAALGLFWRGKREV
jgi:cytochrome c oxidase assembly protein subunit 15